MGIDVLILGCGPAGLIASHAVERLGGSPHIISVKQKSVLTGAQYLHEAIPDLTDKPTGTIKTFRLGSQEGYAKKVYGDPHAPCSWDDQVPRRDAWDLRAVYDELWDRYQSRVTDAKVEWKDLAHFEGAWPLVISTIPATGICFQKVERCGLHVFNWESMWAIDFAPPEIEDNTIVYSGLPDQVWYRSSRVFGHGSTEFGNFSVSSSLYSPANGEGRIFRPKKGIKVKGTNCDCWPRIKRAGRFGTWRKGYLVHQAFADASIHYLEAV